jgi:choline dehydrogenase
MEHELRLNTQQVDYQVTAASLSGSDPSRRCETIVTVPVTPLLWRYVNITSSSTRDLLLVNLSYPSHPTDRELVVQALKRSRSFFHTEAMRPIVVEEHMPGSNVTSDEAILDYIMASSYQNWHASYTCRMGRADDPMTVVDTHAKFIGVDGLRVVDASSFAMLPPVHLQSTVCKSTSEN